MISCVDSVNSNQSNNRQRWGVTQLLPLFPTKSVSFPVMMLSVNLIGHFIVDLDKKDKKKKNVEFFMEGGELTVAACNHPHRLSVSIVKLQNNLKSNKSQFRNNFILLGKVS